MNRKKQASQIVAALEKEYPDAACSLDFQKPYELLISVRLAAQCTDARVNLVTPALFARYPTLESLAEADIDDIEQIVRPCGLGRTKARDIVAMCHMLTNTYGGVVPDEMDKLLRLPGVGRKTANLILGDVYGKPAIVTDTHCIRITNLIGLSSSKNPLQVETQLRAIVKPAKGNDFCHRLVLHGRAVCIARRPNCAICCIKPYCDYGKTKLEPVCIQNKSAQNSF